MSIFIDPTGEPSDPGNQGRRDLLDAAKQGSATVYFLEVQPRRARRPAVASGLPHIHYLSLTSRSCPEAVGGRLRFNGEPRESPLRGADAPPSHGRVAGRPRPMGLSAQTRRLPRHRLQPRHRPDLAAPDADVFAWDISGQIDAASCSRHRLAHMRVPSLPTQNAADAKPSQPIAREGSSEATTQHRQADAKPSRQATTLIAHNHHRSRDLAVGGTLLIARDRARAALRAQRRVTDEPHGSRYRHAGGGRRREAQGDGSQGWA
jgi:hypothetical protein